MGKKTGKSAADDLADPLGGLIDRYGTNLGAALVVSGITALAGVAVAGYALTRQPVATLLLITGGILVFCALVTLGTSVRNLGRRLELRKRGIRFVEYGEAVELRWGDIAAVEVERMDHTNMGIVAKETYSSDAATPSGPLTHTAWKVTIIAHDGRKIRLRPPFLKVVPDVRKLISKVRLRAGIE